MFGMIRKNLNTISIFARRTMSHRDSKPNISGLLEKQKKEIWFAGEKTRGATSNIKSGCSFNQPKHNFSHARYWGGKDKNQDYTQ